MARDRRTVTVEEASQMLGISRAFAYQLVRAGNIPSIRLGRRLVVPMRQLHAMLDGYEQADGVEVPTEWGVLHATCTADGRAVRFMTAAPGIFGVASHISVDGLRYALDVELRFDKNAPGGEKLPGWYVDDCWYVAHMDSLRRLPGGEPATASAQVVLRDQMLPTLVEWLASSDSIALLKEAHD